MFLKQNNFSLFQGLWGPRLWTGSNTDLYEKSENFLKDSNSN